MCLAVATAANHCSTRGHHGGPLVDRLCTVTAPATTPQAESPGLQVPKVPDLGMELRTFSHAGAALAGQSEKRPTA